ncbi:MAG TPA: LamG-like jellyroll fold domain-containing protein [Actinokineospora sp.]|jgi:hypothetical protein|nr:LamG-like jellyroll fold domain-containing protein [Actinokineospora sp.]
MRTSRSRWLIGATVVVLAVGALAVPASAAPSAQARAAGHPVAIDSMTTETDEYIAHPDGTIQWRQFVRPVRVKQDGRWVGVDTTLVRRPDGSIAPKATKTALTLSGGGAGSGNRPLVTLAHQDAEIGLGWGADVPAPVLDGDTATYPEVLPGVDLKITADVIGFSEVLVVKTAEAARNPRIKKLTFGSHARNVKVRQVPGKGRLKDAPRLEGVSPSGEVVFSGDATRMWDSSGDATVRERLTGQGEGLRTATMGNEVGPDSITVLPDQAFLADPATKYPVYIDPEYSCASLGSCTKAHHVVVQSGYPDAKNYDVTSGSLNDLKAGWQNTDTSGISQSFVQMNTSGLYGKVISRASFNTILNYSYWADNESPQSTELRLSALIDGNTTWNNRPYFESSARSTSNVTNKSKASNVSMVFDAKSIAEDISRYGWAQTGFMLKGSTETSTKAWRRFGLNPYLEVWYNSVPTDPTQHAMQNGAVPCVIGENRPWIATRTPRVQARVADPDGGSLAMHVATIGGPVGGDVPGTWHENPNSMPWIGTPGPNQTALAQYDIPSDWITSDGIYKWAVRTYDGGAFSPRWNWDCEFYVDTAVPLAPVVTRTGATPVNQGDQALFSISVDLANTALYDIDRFVYTTDGSEPAVLGSPSIAATKFVDGNGKTTATATITTTAVQANQNLVKVRAVNKAGTPGPNGTCVAPLVTSGNSCAYTVLPLTSAKFLKGAWGLDDSNGTTAADNVAALNSGETAHPLSRVNGAWAVGYNRGNSWTQADAFAAKDGLRGAVQFTSDGQLETAGPVLNTSASFSVAAWVTLANTNSYYTVASQDGTNIGGFFLQYSPDVGKWSFSAVDGDSINEPIYRATSQDGSAAPVLNTWTHLVGTYDAPTRQLTLYVNGKKAGSAVMAKSLFNATGPFVVGAAKWNGGRVDRLPGSVDDVQAWQRVLSADDARALASVSTPRAAYGLAEGAGTNLNTGSTGDELSGNYVPAPVPSLQGYWKFDENTGSTAYDSSNNGAGYENNLITTGATWVPGRSGTALHYSGTSGSFSKSAGKAVNTAQSFTVSAWARLDDLTGYQAVFGQSGTNMPGFQLRYSSDVQAWIFGVPKSDTAGALTEWTYRANTVTQAGVWSHVTGVFDSETRQVRLYVDGKLTGSRSFTGVPWDSNGPVTVGMYEFGGAAAHLFKGAIDDVRIWQRALTDSQVAGLVGLGPTDAVWHHTAASAPLTGDVTLTSDTNAARAQFTGNAGSVITAPRPENFRTDRSYTLSAWVKLESSTDGTRGVLAVDDTMNGPFMLGVRKDELPAGKWVFTVPCSSSNLSCMKHAYSDAPAARDDWTHLAATYDAATDTACLYVDGHKQSSCISGVGAFNSAGNLLIGRVRWNSSYVDHWQGGIAGVRASSGVRTTEQIQRDMAYDDPGALYGVSH